MKRRTGFLKGWGGLKNQSYSKYPHIFFNSLKSDQNSEHLSRCALKMARLKLLHTIAIACCYESDETFFWRSSGNVCKCIYLCRFNVYVADKDFNILKIFFFDVRS